jgi:hypothetical protein
MEHQLMGYQKIGQDFSKSIILNIIPHEQPLGGVYQVQIDWISQPNDPISRATEFNSDTFVTDVNRSINVMVGIDVYSISYVIVPLTNVHLPLKYFNGTIRTDRLILLNFAEKLLGINRRALATSP